MNNADKRRRAIELRKAGWSQRQIANELGLSKTTVQRYLSGNGVDHPADRSLDRSMDHPRPRPQNAGSGGPVQARSTPVHADRSTRSRESERPIEKFLHLLSGLKRSGSEWAARCPAHDDQHQSLTIREKDDGRVLVHCHAGCTPIQIVTALGLRIGDLFPPDKRARRRIVATYDYCDAQGELLYQVVRYDPKDFRQRRPTDDGWTWDMNGVPRVLYRLPELIAADPDAWVLIVEGEKDADRLAALGLVATCNPGGAGKWSRLADDSALEGRRVAIIADKDAPGRRHAEDVARRLHGWAREVRIVELPGDAKDAADWLDAGGTAEELLRLIEQAAPAQPDPNEPIPRDIIIGPDEYRVVRETVEAMRDDPELYTRGNVLVRVIVNDRPDPQGEQQQSYASVAMLPEADLRTRMTRYATFWRPKKDGDEVHCHPPEWLPRAVAALGRWEGIPSLEAVSDAPVLRSDGSIWHGPGYDEQTGVLVVPRKGLKVEPIRSEADIDIDDADAALSELLEVVCDFPFEDEAHRAAWLAALLTPLARFAFSGPAPMFVFDANVRGAGKTLLAQTIAHIVLGHDMPARSYVHDPEEMRKKLTAIAISGDRMVLFDNIAGAFGNDALDRALTSTMWKDRILGRSQEIELPLVPAWYATGNNIQIAADTLRRIVHVRLDCLVERPEDRSGFRHEHLLRWIDEHRGRLLRAGLTILSAYLRNGATKQGLKPFGSFEGWSGVVREAVVWLGLPDPCSTRYALEETADTTSDALRQLIDAWRLYRPDGRPILISELLRELYPPDGTGPQDGPSTAMRAALETIAGCPPGRTPTARQVANRLRSFRKRVVEGAYLDYDDSLGRKHGRWWKLVEQAGDGDSVTQGESHLANL